MTRATVLVVALAACGRIDFAQVADGAASPEDDAIDSCTDAFGPDEDSDGSPDACDVCPHVSDDQADSDGDGVGDLCDVEPMLPRQRIQFFDGFNTERTEWNYGGTVTGGQFINPVNAGASNNVLTIPTSLADIQVGGTILAVGAIPNHLFVAVQSAPNESYYIELIDQGTGRRRSLMYAIDTTYSELSGMTDTGMVVQPGPVTLHLSIRASEMVGSIETVGAATMQFSRSGTPTISSEKMLLYMQNLSVVLDYAVVIETL